MQNNIVTTSAEKIIFFLALIKEATSRLVHVCDLSQPAGKSQASSILNFSNVTDFCQQIAICRTYSF